jgi:hypothetical protein
MTTPATDLTDDDIRYELRVMQRWCRLFRRTDFDWVSLEAERFRQRHPVSRSGRRGPRAA